MIVLFLLSFCPFNNFVVDYVDICELNHVILTPKDNSAYWVWWRLYTVNGHTDYYVADWRSQSEVPAPINGVQEFYDTSSKVMRRITSRIQEETWSTFDREVFDRKRLPAERRRKLCHFH